MFRKVELIMGLQSEINVYFLLENLVYYSFEYIWIYCYFNNDTFDQYLEEF